MYYSIKINKTGRYLNWCDNHWYQTAPYSPCKFTREECDTIFNQLVNHYVFDITLIGEDDSEIHLSYFAKKNEVKLKPIIKPSVKPKAITPQIPTKIPVSNNKESSMKKKILSFSRKFSIKSFFNIKK